MPNILVVFLWGGRKLIYIFFMNDKNNSEYTNLRAHDKKNKNFFVIILMLNIWIEIYGML